MRLILILTLLTSITLSQKIYVNIMGIDTGGGELTGNFVMNHYHDFMNALESSKIFKNCVIITRENSLGNKVLEKGSFYLDVRSSLPCHFSYSVVYCVEDWNWYDLPNYKSGGLYLGTNSMTNSFSNFDSTDFESYIEGLENWFDQFEDGIFNYDVDKETKPRNISTDHTQNIYINAMALDGETFRHLSTDYVNEVQRLEKALNSSKIKDQCIIIDRNNYEKYQLLEEGSICIIFNTYPNKSISFTTVYVTDDWNWSDWGNGNKFGGAFLAINSSAGGATFNSIMKDVERHLDNLEKDGIFKYKE